jgi:hypothetical protein
MQESERGGGWLARTSGSGAKAECAGGGSSKGGASATAGAGTAKSDATESRLIGAGSSLPVGAEQLMPEQSEGSPGAQQQQAGGGVDPASHVRAAPF